jgi:heme oxygenase
MEIEFTCLSDVTLTKCELVTQRYLLNFCTEDLEGVSTTAVDMTVFTEILFNKTNYRDSFQSDLLILIFDKSSGVKYLFQDSQ